MIKLKFLLLFYFICFQYANAQSNYPILKEIVTDNAKLFSESETHDLRAKLIEYQETTSHQIVVLTINDLGADTIENYAFQTFNMVGNQFGKEKADNGILILVAKNNRKFRIEVGDGLTPIITDLIASRINRNYITPAFKKGNYFKGIDSAISEIIKIIEDPIYADEFANIDDNDSNDVSIIKTFFSSLFLTLFFFVAGLLGYNKFVVKHKSHKIRVKELYADYKIKFVGIVLSVICLIMYFNAFFWDVFIGLFIVAFLSVFIAIGFFVILKRAYERAVAIFTALFTGKLGVIIFPFYLPVTLLLFLGGCIFCFMPLVMGVMFVITTVFNNDINEVMHNAKPLYFFFFIISVFLLYLIITAVVAYKNIRNSLKESFGFSFFKIGKTLLGVNGSGFSKGYSSSGSSNYSSSRSSSSSHSFSGDGGSSSGGGASGSW